MTGCDNNPLSHVDFPVIEYSIDAEDRLIDFNPAWDAFALTNKSPHLVAALIRNRFLFDFIGGESLRELWRMLLQRARAAENPITCIFRCDSEQYKRYMNLRIVRDKNILHFISTTVTVQYIPGLRIFDVAEPRSDSPLTVCSWCKKILTENGEWLEPEAAVEAMNLFERRPLPKLSHGICESCLGQVLPGHKG